MTELHPTHVFFFFVFLLLSLIDTHDFSKIFKKPYFLFFSKNDSLPSFVLVFMYICCIYFIKAKNDKLLIEFMFGLLSLALQNDKLFELTGRPSCYFSYFNRFYSGKMADSAPELLYSYIGFV